MEEIPRSPAEKAGKIDRERGQRKVNQSPTGMTSTYDATVTKWRSEEEEQGGRSWQREIYGGGVEYVMRERRAVMQ